MIKFEENTVYWCKTEELANKLLKEADRQGFKWGSKDNCWNVHKEETCYLIKKREYCYKAWYEQRNYKIVEVTEEMFKTMNREEIQAEIEKFCKWYKGNPFQVISSKAGSRPEEITQNYMNQNYPLVETKEMTVAELEKQLGYKIKIVK